MRRHPRKNDLGCKPRKLYGWYPILEHLRVRPQEIQELYVLPTLRGTTVEQLAQQARVPVRYESRPFFDSFTQGGVHQGVAARLQAFPYVALNDLLRKEPDLLLVVDQVLDPRNLGALLRTAEAVDVGGVILTETRTAPISPLVEKTAAGATAHLSICRIGNLARTLVTVREAGYWLVGLTPEATQTLYELRISQKIALILGGEEKGLRPLTQHLCDCLVAIPMQGRIESLNISVAGAIALYELLRRKIQGKEVLP